VVCARVLSRRAFVCRYADLKVKMAAMEAEKDGEADLKDEWQ